MAGRKVVLSVVGTISELGPSHNSDALSCPIYILECPLTNGMALCCTTILLIRDTVGYRLSHAKSAARRFGLGEFGGGLGGRSRTIPPTYRLAYLISHPICTNKRVVVWCLCFCVPVCLYVCVHAIPPPPSPTFPEINHQLQRGDLGQPMLMVTACAFCFGVRSALSM